MPIAESQAALQRRLGERYPLVDTTITAAGRIWSVTAVSNQDALLESVQTEEDLAQFPYGLLLWASAVGLAERLAGTSFTGARVLELGAGAGLPGMVARLRGADVTQSDYQEEALTLARLNAARNGIAGISYLRGDWRDFPDLPPFEHVIGSDILYERSLHAPLLALLPRLLAPGGILLISDPLRPQAVDFIGRLEAAGWQVDMDSHTVSWEATPREIALFTATRPAVTP